ncbi:hypothetical protein ACVPOS_10225 [Staphylococcus aureus]
MKTLKMSKLCFSVTKKRYNLNHERIEFRHRSEKIEMEDEPVRAIKRKNSQR